MLFSVNTLKTSYSSPVKYFIYSKCFPFPLQWRLMRAMAFQITGVSIVRSTVDSGTDQRKHRKPCVTGLYAGNSPVTGEFFAQKSSNAENVSIWWKKTTKAPHHWPLGGGGGGIHRGRWIPRTNGQLCGKCFHLMTSSCFIPVSIP